MQYVMVRSTDAATMDAVPATLKNLANGAVPTRRTAVDNNRDLTAGTYGVTKVRRRRWQGVFAEAVRYIMRFFKRRTDYGRVRALRSP